MYCWICRNKVSRFTAYGIPSRLGKCPHCGAKPRGRLLGWFLEQVLIPALPADARILEVGPSKFSTQGLLPRTDASRPWTLIDVRRTAAQRRVQSPHRFLQMDVCELGFRDNCFDLILCNNVLTYVRRDREALAEIRRCLKPEGIAMINTHTGRGATVAAEAHRRCHPEMGDDFYAVNGDQWVYGDDFYSRIEDAGLKFRIISLFENRPEEFLRENGLKRVNECLLACIEPVALERCLHQDVRIR